jgi:hypothetical protein
MKKPTHLGRLFHSPDKSIGRTFRAVFVLPPTRRGEKTAKRKPSRTYRNPIFLAREWAAAMEGGNFQSKRAFARAIGLSHARVSQVLGLLRLCSEVQQGLEALGDPLYSRKVTERKLRPIVNLPEEKQELGLREML